MTLCIAWKNGDDVYFAADSKINYGSMPSERGEKVFSAHGIVWAMSGDVSAEHALRTADCKPFRGRGTQQFSDWYVKKLHPKIQERIDDEDHDECAFDLIASVRGELWTASSGMDLVKSTRPYVCIGSGAQYAYGAVEALARISKDYTKVDYVYVCNLVGTMCDSVGGPYREYRVKKNGHYDILRTL